MRRRSGNTRQVGRSPEPGHRNAVVLHHAATILVPLTELGLRRSVSRLGQLTESSDVQLSDVSLRRIGPWRVGRRWIGWNRCAHGDRRARGQRSAIAGGRRPPDPPRCKEMKAQELIKRPRHAKTVAEMPSAGGEPEARAGTQVQPFGPPPTAAQHTAAAVALPAVLRPLPQISDHVGQTRRVRTVGADRTRSHIPRWIEVVTSALRPGRRPRPFRLGRQPIRRARRPAQPRHVRLRVVPAHARHRMTIRLRY